MYTLHVGCVDCSTGSETTEPTSATAPYLLPDSTAFLVTVILLLVLLIALPLLAGCVCLTLKGRQSKSENDQPEAENDNELMELV